MSNHLNLNKDNIKKSVVSKLKMLGYKVNNDTAIWRIKDIIIAIQRDNGLMVDGLIGVKTMPLLGYGNDEISKMLKMSKHTYRLSYNYPSWPFFC